MHTLTFRVFGHFGAPPFLLLMRRLLFSLDFFKPHCRLVSSTCPEMCSDDEDSCCDCGLPPTVERRLLLTLVWSLIAFAYVSYYVVLIIPWNYHHSAWGIAHLLFFNVVVGLLVTSYWKAIFTNAGDVPRNYVRSAHFSNHPQLLVC